VDVDQEVIWKQIADWPTASLAELALRIHNKLHIRADHVSESLRRADPVYTKQVREHDNPQRSDLASYERQLRR
jgi:subtilase family serine protease